MLGTVPPTVLKIFIAIIIDGVEVKTGTSEMVLLSYISISLR